MNYLKRWGKAFLALSLMLVFALANASSVLAQPLAVSLTSSSLAEVSLGNKIKGEADQAAGKIQETVGNLSGDRETQIDGKLKQAEGQIRVVPSDARGNKVTRISESDIKGKTQQAESNIRRFQARADQD